MPTNTFHYFVSRSRHNVGDSHKGPLITGEKPISSQNNKNTNKLTHCKLHLTQSRPDDTSPRPWQPQRPIKRLAPAPLGRNSASLEGPGAVLPKLRLARGLDDPRVRLRLARGLCAPSGGSPPHSGFSRVRRPRAHFPDRSIKCSDMSRAPGSRMNPRHAGSLTPPGNRIPALFHQPSL
jgi:hypothetical protein